MVADVKYRAELDDSQVLDELRKINRNFEDVGNRGDQAFRKVGASVKAAAIAIGIISGVVNALANRLIYMASGVLRDLIGGLKSMVSEVINSSDEFKAFSKQLEDFRTELVKIAGESFFEQIREDAGVFLNILEEQRGPLSDIAIAFGEIIASIERGTLGALLDQLQELDPKVMREFADATQRLADALSQLTDTEIAADVNGLIQLFTMLSDVISTLINVYNKLNEIMELPVLKQVGDVVGSILNPLARMIEAIGQLTKVWHDLNVELEKFLGFSLVDVTAGLAQATSGVPAGGQAGLGSTLPPLAGRPQPIIPPAEDVEKKAKETEKKVKEFYDRLEELEKKSADARQRIGDMMDRASQDTIEAGRRRLEIDIETERERIDNAIQAAQEREDIARKNAQVIEDIYRKYQQEIADAGIDLSREEQDIARKAARDRIQVERDAAREQVNIETEFRRELQRIRDRFLMAAAEAERNNDAQAFLAAVRQRDSEMVDARRTRDENLQDARTQAEEQRAAINEQLQYELEDARLANQRKLEDLQLRLNRELEAQRLNYQRELEEQAIKEQRAEEARLLAYQRELADFAAKEQQRLADLQRSLAKEIEMVAAAERMKREIRVAEAQAAIQQVQSIMQQVGLRQPAARPIAGVYTHRRQAGGETQAGRPYIVGEAGPELFIPDRRGMVVPNAALGAAVSNVSTVFNNQRNIAPTFNVAEDMFNSPTAVRRLHNIIMGVMSEVL